MQTMNELDRLNFADLRAYVENPLGTEPWLTVYEYTERDSEKIGYFCALVPLEKVPDCLGERSWDLLIGHGFPGRITGAIKVSISGLVMITALSLSYFSEVFLARSGLTLKYRKNFDTFITSMKTARMIPLWHLTKRATKKTLSELRERKSKYLPRISATTWRNETWRCCCSLNLIDGAAKLLITLHREIGPRAVR